MRLKIYKNETSNLKLPLFLSEVPAGFPSPADTYLDEGLDLNQILVKHPAATFFVRVQGESMQGANIHAGDVLVVDRSVEPKHRDIVVAILDGEFTVKRMIKRNGVLLLVPENTAYSSIAVSDERDFQIWGVVTYVIHKAR